MQHKGQTRSLDTRWGLSLITWHYWILSWWCPKAVNPTVSTLTLIKQIPRKLEHKIQRESRFCNLKEFWAAGPEMNLKSVGGSAGWGWRWEALPGNESRSWRLGVWADPVPWVALFIAKISAFLYCNDGLLCSRGWGGNLLAVWDTIFLTQWT